jgi:ribosomal-protein-alanine N-acetyltransferase
LIGRLGFKGKPEHGAVEIGYGIVPAHRQQGYATEAGQVLIARAFR